MDAARRSISYEEFVALAGARNCRALSVKCRPLAGESCWRYECSLRDLLSSPVYPVWFVDKGGMKFLNYDDPDARPILLAELAGAGCSLGSEVRRRLDEWYKPELGVPSRACFVTLHCAGCGRRVLIDGVHRALWLIREGRLDVPVDVVELSGSTWQSCTPDLNVVCVCGRGRG